MATSVRIFLSDFCFPQNLFLERTYPRLVLCTLNEPQKTHFLPLKKLAAHPKTFFRPCAIWIFKAYPVSLLRGSIKGGFGKPLVSQDSRAKLLDTPPIWSEAE